MPHGFRHSIPRGDGRDCHQCVLRRLARQRGPARVPAPAAASMTKSGGRYGAFTAADASPALPRAHDTDRSRRCSACHAASVL
jgi:hypothetical protein